MHRWINLELMVIVRTHIQPQIFTTRVQKCQCHSTMRFPASITAMETLK